MPALAIQSKLPSGSIPISARLRVVAFGDKQSKSVPAAYAKPASTHTVCIAGIAGEKGICHEVPAIPRRLHPQLNGSDRLCSTNAPHRETGSEGERDPATQSEWVARK